MKLFTFVLAIFFLGLSFIPCADEEVSGVDNLALTFDVGADHHHSGDADFCSPFCLCQCCNSHFTNNASFIGLPILKPMLDRSPIIIDNLVNGYLDNILEPPRA